MWVAWFPKQKESAASKAAAKECTTKILFNTKEKGIITNGFCQLVLQLISEGVGTEHIESVTAAVCETLGVKLIGHISA